MVFHSLPTLKDPIRGDRSILRVGRSADHPHITELEAEEEAYFATLESIRLSGFKFLKPPGVTKTLKVMHEEESYLRDMSYYSSQAMSHFDSHNGHITNNTAQVAHESQTRNTLNNDPRLDPHIDAEISYASSFVDERMLDDERGASDDENFSSNDMMNASFPSMYHRS